MHNPAHKRVWITLLISTMVIMTSIGVFGLLFVVDPAVAQNQAFVTNTPTGEDPLAVQRDAPLEQYALRLWTEKDMLDVLASQLIRLSRGESDQQTAIQLTLYELERRFPGAPRSAEARVQVMNTMLRTPRGTVDMRSVIRPYILNALNVLAPETLSGSIDLNGFRIQFNPVNLNGMAPQDAVIYIRYPASIQSRDDILYEEYLPIIAQGDGTYALAPLPETLYAAPFDTLESISLVRLGDVNLDGLGELVLSMDTGQLNKELTILGWRNGAFINLAAPGETIVYGEIISWPVGDSTLIVNTYREESIQWDCTSALPVTWKWLNNAYRPELGLNPRYTPLDTVGCRAYEEEPVFAQPTDVIAQTLYDLLEAASPTDQGYDRVGMALAMVYALGGQRTSADAQVENLLPLTQDSPWLADQIEAYTQARNDNVSPVQICGALIQTDPNGACNMDQVIARILAGRQVLRDQDVVEQLEDFSLPVLETVTVTQVGMANRLVVNFALPGASWWAFAPTQPTTYVASIAEPPRGFEPATLPEGPVTPNKAAYNALLINDDPFTALNTVDNLQQVNPSRPLSPEALYLQALSFDLLANRQEARLAYFALWRDFPNTTWGRMAAAHLERR